MTDTYDCLVEVVASCWECSKFFVTRNKRNQAIFVEQVDVMVDLIGGIMDDRAYPDFGVITTVSETYRNNTALISKFAPENCHTFAAIVAHNHSDPMPYVGQWWLKRGGQQRWLDDRQPRSPAPALETTTAIVAVVTAPSS